MQFVPKFNCSEIEGSLSCGGFIQRNMWHLGVSCGTLSNASF